MKGGREGRQVVGSRPRAGFTNDTRRRPSTRVEDGAGTYTLTRTSTYRHTRVHPGLVVRAPWEEWGGTEVQEAPGPRRRVPGPRPAPVVTVGPPRATLREGGDVADDEVAPDGCRVRRLRLHSPAGAPGVPPSPRRTWDQRVSCKDEGRVEDVQDGLKPCPTGTSRTFLSEQENVFVVAAEGSPGLSLTLRRPHAPGRVREEGLGGVRRPLGRRGGLPTFRCRTPTPARMVGPQGAGLGTGPTS